ncbi:hypothetical protein [Nocardia mexicana]|uniref:Uncharacterized protein n=1 Tax=Nocardia mexicana TaxID=279262 RepID=A0A370GZG1_9NOCA|nr:hypothetical protein [Nocardia mexicana]RDI49054.1 hypothetical protein DFR68_107179 [Nocardia mexicana]
MIKKTVATGMGALGIAAAATVFLPATASAASYDKDMCGAGYEVIDKHELTGGTIFLTYNGEQNCVVTVRDHQGDRMPMGAGVQVFDGKANPAENQNGDFTWYAGPVRIQAKGLCVDWGGYIGENNGWKATSVKGDKAGEHCGS